MTFEELANSEWEFPLLGKKFPQPRNGKSIPV
jgi:hypothetical protein